jgi:YidC/Oxa1 family membrane protein insertase
MPKQNLLLFIVVTALLIAGWWLVQSWKTPEPAKDDGQTQAKSTDKGKKDPADKGKQGGEPPRQDAGAVNRQVAFALGVPHDENEKVYHLGDPRFPYYILATVTNRGGGIRQLTLPKFQKADANGKPVFEADGKTPAPLQLIQDDPVVASYLMYHYPKADVEECLVALGQQIWQVLKAETTSERSILVLTTEVPGYSKLRVVKTFELLPRQYHVNLTVEIHDDRKSTDADNGPRTFRYQLAGAHGLPIEGEWYTSVYRTPMIGILDNRGVLWRELDETQHTISVKAGGNRIPLASLGDSMIQYAGAATQYFAALIVVDDRQEGSVKPRDLLAYCRPTRESEEVQGVVVSVSKVEGGMSRLGIQTREGVPQKFDFVLLPRAGAEADQLSLKAGDVVFVSYYDPEDGGKVLVATHVRTGNARRRQFDDFTVRVVSNVLTLKPGESVTHKYVLYHGPSKVMLLRQFTGDEAVDSELVDRYADTLNLRTLTDYRSAGFFGWISSKIFWTNILLTTTTWMHWLLYWLHYLVGSYGLTIMLLTLLVRGAMFPISRRSAMLSLKMQALAPEMRKVQEKYKDDPQAKTAAIMELYRKHGVNPFGSCLPMVMQLPFFLGLYYCLQESIHFRLAPFLWIDNLAAPDMAVYWGHGIPIISDPDNMSGSFLSFLYLGPYLNVLPILAVALMLIQQKMMTPPPADEQQEMQQKMMKYMFVFIGIMFYKVAAGLCIYFVISSLWGLAERKMLPKKLTGPGTAPANGPAPSGGAPRGKGKPARKDKDKEKKPDTALQRVKDWWAEVLKQAQKK